jgi:hypothetical protein
MNKFMDTRQLGELPEVARAYDAAKLPHCPVDIERHHPSGLVSLLAGRSSDRITLDATDEATDWFEAVIADLDREALGRVH